MFFSCFYITVHASGCVFGELCLQSIDKHSKCTAIITIMVKYIKTPIYKKAYHNVKSQWLVTGDSRYVQSFNRSVDYRLDFRTLTFKWLG